MARMARVEVFAPDESVRNFSVFRVEGFASVFEY